MANVLVWLAKLKLPSSSAFELKPKQMYIMLCHWMFHNLFWYFTCLLLDRISFVSMYAIVARLASLIWNMMHRHAVLASSCYTIGYTNGFWGTTSERSQNAAGLARQSQYGNIDRTMMLINIWWTSSYAYGHACRVDNDVIHNLKSFLGLS